MLHVYLRDGKIMQRVFHRQHEHIQSLSDIYKPITPECRLLSLKMIWSCNKYTRQAFWVRLQATIQTTQFLVMYTSNYHRLGYPSKWMNRAHEMPSSSLPWEDYMLFIIWATNSCHSHRLFVNVEECSWLWPSNFHRVRIEIHQQHRNYTLSHLIRSLISSELNQRWFLRDVKTTKLFWQSGNGTRFQYS